MGGGGGLPDTRPDDIQPRGIFGDGSKVTFVIQFKYLPASDRRNGLAPQLGEFWKILFFSQFVSISPFIVPNAS